MKGELIGLSVTSPHSTASCGLHQINSPGWRALAASLQRSAHTAVWHARGRLHPTQDTQSACVQTPLSMACFSHTYPALTALGTAKSWTLASWEQPSQQLPRCKTILSENTTPRHPTSHARTNNSTLGQLAHSWRDDLLNKHHYSLQYVPMSFGSKNAEKFSKCISTSSLNKTFRDVPRICYRCGAVQTRVTDKNTCKL